MSTQPPGWSDRPLPAPQPFPGRQYPPGGAAPTGYGYGPPAPGHVPGYPPYPPQRKAPPKKRWYGVGAALLLAGVAAVAFGAFGLSAFSDAAPQSSFGSGEMTTVHFAAGETKVIFVANAGEKHHVRCNVGTRTGSDDDIKMDNYDGSLTINQWQAVFTVTAQNASDYAVKCEGVASDEFGVGGDAKATSLVGGIFAIVGGGFLCVLGIVTLLVTAILQWRRKA